MTSDLTTDMVRADTSAVEPETPVLEIRGISRAFGSTQALSDVSMTLRGGEVHALLGENGAGKSTLIKIMTGVEQPDSGEILIDGRPVAIGNALEAQRLGVAAIYQEPMIFPDLSVAENVFIAHRDRGRVVRRRQMRDETRTVLDSLDVSFDVDQPARGLTLAQQQTVEIAKALSQKVRVLIMDEPTASLSAHEVNQLLAIVSNLRRQGVAVLFISHRLEEVFRIADRITVFRDGRWISSRPRADVTTASAIRDMVGRAVVDLFARTPSHPGPTLLEVRGLRREGVFEDVSFELRQGEVLGFAGLVGARRTDVGLALFGIEPASGGEILVEGRPVTIRKPSDALKLGIAYATEDRRALGLVFPLSISANITLPSLQRYLNRLGLLRTEDEQATAERFKSQLDIRTRSVTARVATLSGGNQQKVVLSKWLETRPRILILDEPTRGIDIGAKVEVHRIIDQLAQDGIAIIMISSDLPEVMAMSDRILVMREGRQMAIVDHAEATSEGILAAAMGQERDEIPAESSAATGSVAAP